MNTYQSDIDRFRKAAVKTLAQESGKSESEVSRVLKTETSPTGTISFVDPETSRCVPFRLSGVAS